MHGQQNMKIIHYSSGINIFNRLPCGPTNLMNEGASFKVPLKRYFYMHSFYSVEEFFYV